MTAPLSPGAVAALEALLPLFVAGVGALVSITWARFKERWPRLDRLSPGEQRTLLVLGNAAIAWVATVVGAQAVDINDLDDAAWLAFAQSVATFLLHLVNKQHQGQRPTHGGDAPPQP